MRKRCLYKNCILALALIGALTLTGCNDEVQWFESKEEGEISGVDPEDLMLDTYYIKNGTKFYQAYIPESGTGLSLSSSANGNRVIGIRETDEYAIPDHFLGEIVAYKSSSNILEEVTLERYKDLGYSLGLYKGYFDTEGYFCCDNSSSSFIKESMFSQFADANDSRDIRITTINGQKVTPEMVDMESGIIMGLEKNGIYRLGVLFGTNYKEANIKADCHMFKSYEMFSYDKDTLKFTQNGYMSFQTPKNLKSGYYWINGKGLFRYFDFKKGDMDEVSVSMNTPFYASEQERLAASSKQYTVNLKTKVRDLKISAFLSETDLVNAAGYVFSPDGLKYEMVKDEKEGTLYLALTQAMLGQWTVNIMPKNIDMDYKDLVVESTADDEEATLEQKVFTFDEDITNMVFEARITGDGEVYGYIQDADNNIHDLILEEVEDSDGESRIYYEVPYLTAGEYTMKIYHHPSETEVLDMDAHQNVNVETETIIVTD